MKDHIWADLCDWKFKSYLLGILEYKYQKWDRNLNVFLAIVSSSSVATWAIWKKFDLIWGIIIMASQVINAAKPYFPYFKVVRELNIKSKELDFIAIDIESLWYNYQKREIDEKDASAQHMVLRKRAIEILSFPEGIVFNHSKNDERRANEKMKIYLKSHYNIDININN